MTTRLIGTCPVCERQQKVTPGGAMVHHGFQRPGVGHIIGDCFGVGWRAYELSSAGCVAYRKTLAAWRATEEAYLARLQARPETISIESYTRQMKTYRRDSTDREERHRYETTLQNTIQGVEYAIKDIARSDRRMVELIDKWAPAPLIEIDEEGLTPARREERTARKNERDAKREEKELKRREMNVKRNERLARKATTLLFFFDEFDRLAQQPASTARSLYARDLLFEAAKKKHGISYPRELWMGPDDGYGNKMRGPWGRATEEHALQTLIDLGVAHREKHAHGDYVVVARVYATQGNKIRVPEPDGPAEEVLDTIAQMRPPGSSSSS